MLWIDLYEVAGAVPEESRPGEEVVHLVGAIGLDAEPVDWELGPVEIRSVAFYYSRGVAKVE